MSARFLDEAARTAFDRAIRTIEDASGAEVVVSVRRRSHTYRHANLLVAVLVAFGALAAMLFSDHPFGLASILIDPFTVALAAGALVELLPGVKRVLTSPRIRHVHVERAARSTFVERGVHATASRGGVLVYISWLEQQVVLVADTELARLAGAEALARLETELTTAMPHGGERVASALGSASAMFATALPRRSDDINELPNAIDSDLHARRQR